MYSVRQCVSLLLLLYQSMVSLSDFIQHVSCRTIYHVAVSLIIVVFGFVIMMMFSGFLVDLPSIFASLRWIQWVSAVRYASNILTINEFRNLKLCLSNNTNVCPLTGEQVLTERHIDHTNQWDMWKNFLALSLMAIVFLLLSYIQLLRIKKYK
jgi:ATP-binding cassette subfamily G (WHITE) protein 2